MGLRTRLAAALIASSATTPALAQQCGGDFDAWKNVVSTEATAAKVGDLGHAALASARIDEKVLQRDRAQGVFSQTFIEFSNRMISGYRLKQGAANLKKYADVFQRSEAEFGVPPAVIAAFWALETDFGAVQGDFNTRNALLTLAHDCRRPEIFQPQVIAAVALTGMHDFDPASTTGAWAGEIGMVQMLPKDILEKGIDGDGDGLITLKTSAPDALLSGANMLRHHGWRAGEPWLQEVILPETLDWSLSGLETERPAGDWAAMGVQPRAGNLPDLPASLLLPQGRKGPAFLAYPNFKVLFEWNKSFVYVTTAAYFATRLEGAEPYRAGNPDPALSADQMTALQERLAARGHDVGKIDGILGALTRTAVQKEQARLGLPADGWPTAELLNAL